MAYINGKQIKSFDELDIKNEAGLIYQCFIALISLNNNLISDEVLAFLNKIETSLEHMDNQEDAEKIIHALDDASEEIRDKVNTLLEEKVGNVTTSY